MPQMLKPIHTSLDLKLRFCRIVIFYALQRSMGQNGEYWKSNYKAENLGKTNVERYLYTSELNMMNRVGDESQIKQ